jgi:Ser/Thr protein kinase RdoA (MazF antagonist)/thymidylate kinase
MGPTMVIELAGPPGAGKTSLQPTVLRACEAAGLQPYTVEHAARAFARRTAAGRVAAQLPAPADRRALWAVFYVGSAVGAVRLACRRPAMTLHIARTQWRRPPEAEGRARRVLYWYFRTAGAYEFLRRRGRSDEAVIIDEGFVHRAVQLHASSVERPTPRQIARYVNALPPSDLVILVRAPAEVCRQRVRSRGVWERLQHRSADDIDRFVSNAHLAIGLAGDSLRDIGQPVVVIDNTGDIADTRIALTGRLGAALSRTGPQRGAAGTSPRVRLPRLARLIDGITARSAPPAIALRTCAEVLEHYRLELTRSPDNIPFGRRNHNVVVTTDVGRRVLRRYRTTAEPDSVMHEHAVLTELERRGFPAVRLARTAAGGTIVAHDGHLYALFEFEHGANLASYVFPGRASRTRILTTAARTLARLHRELADFTPEAAHHLGYHPASGERRRDLRWHLEALSVLPSRHPTAGPDGQRHHRELAARSEALASRLSRLDAALTQAPLPRVMIHGDYGVHNLLFRRDGVAVVGDFELARREWRLIDLIIVLSRMPIGHGRTFIDAYRRASAIPADEWSNLADVWQYYRLTGAVQSWHNHFVHGGAQRLATARARVDEAEWARTQLVSLWR